MAGPSCWAKPAGGLEVQLKGSGLTPYSRMGDGRAVLRSSIREFLCSEAMHALGIPTSRALCVTGRPAPVRREEMETAAVVTRVAPSFIRFRPFRAFRTPVARWTLRTLADYVIDRYLPGLPHQGSLVATLCSPAAGRERAHRQPDGALAGRGLLPRRDEHRQHEHSGPDHRLRAVPVSGCLRPGHICNHSDTQGRYAFNRQPNVAYWNLHCLAQALLPLIGDKSWPGRPWRRTNRFFHRLHGPHARQAGPCRRACRRCRPDRRDLAAAGRKRGGLHHLLAPPVARRGGGDFERCATCLPTVRAGTSGCYHIELLALTQ
jgi:hypothetical protein